MTDTRASGPLGAASAAGRNRIRGDVLAMNSKTPLLVAALGIALVAALAFWWFGGDRPAPGPIGGPDTPRAESTDPEVAAAEVGERATTRVAADSERRRAPGAGLHPSVAAALVGFTGRVVTSSGEPVPDSLVKLFRFAVDAVIRPSVSVFAEGPKNEPEIEAGETRTGSDGRFVLEGVFPRAFFMLKADADGDAPTWRILDESPDPGELLDLGDIVLADCGILTGTVIGPDGEPVPDALVRAVDFPDPGGFFLGQVPLDRVDPEGGLILSPEIRKDTAVTAPAWVADRFDELPIPTTRTAADGTFRLTGIVPGGNLFVISKPRLLSHIQPLIRLDAGEEKDLGTIRMRLGEIAGGTVVDQDGEPVVGAEVMIASKSSLIPLHFASRADVTDAEGRFEMTGFPPRDVYGAARRNAGEPWTVGGPVNVADELVIELPSVHTLTLTVLGPDGEPVADPKLQLTPGHDGAIEMQMFGATQPLDLDDRLGRDKEGRNLIRDVPKGEYTLLATAPDCAVSSAELTIDADLAHTIELIGAQRFDVVARHAEGGPVAGADVFVIARGEPPRVPEAPVHAATTSDEGTATITSVRATEVRITASHPAYGNVHARTPLPAAGPVELVFPTPGTIEGSLLEGGASPEPGKWMVTLIPRGRASGAMPDIPRVVAPGLDGSFRATGLSPGGYLVTVVRSATMLSSPGKSVDLVTALMLSGDVPRESVELPPGETVRVTLDALQQKRVDGPSARVSGTLVVDGRLGTNYLVQGRSGRFRNAVEVDDQGRFDLGALPAGQVTVQVSPRPSGSLLDFRRLGQQIWSESFELVANEDRVIDIEVATAPIAGIVIGPDGQPVSGARVELMVWVPRTLNPDDVRRDQFRDRTDGSGRFSFDEVPAGTFTVQANGDGARGRLEAMRAEPGIGRRDLRVVLDALPRVSGKVDLTIFGSQRPRWLGMWFQPVGEARETNPGGWVGIGDDGTFETRELEPGVYRVRINHSNVEGFEPGGQLVHASNVEIPASGVSGLVIVPTVQQNESNRDR